MSAPVNVLALLDVLSRREFSGVDFGVPDARVALAHLLNEAHKLADRYPHDRIFDPLRDALARVEGAA